MNPFFAQMLAAAAQKKESAYVELTFDSLKSNVSIRYQSPEEMKITSGGVVVGVLPANSSYAQGSTALSVATSQYRIELPNGAILFDPSNPIGGGPNWTGMLHAKIRGYSPSSLQDLFYACNTMISVDIDETELTKNCTKGWRVFADCRNLVFIPTPQYWWENPNWTGDHRYVFRNCFSMPNYADIPVNWGGGPVDGSAGVFVKSGTETVSSAMVMSDTAIASGQEQYVYNNGYADSCTISSGGFQYVSSGGVANNTLVVYGASATVLSAGLASNTVACGRFYVNALGSAFDTVISAVPGQQSAAMLVSADAQRRGYASGVAVYSNGAFYARSRNCYNVIVYAGGLAGVYQYSEIHSTTVSSGGSMMVAPGGSGVSVTVESGGKLTVSSGGTALAVTANAGAVVTVLDGGRIEYA